MSPAAKPRGVLAMRADLRLSIKIGVIAHATMLAGDAIAGLISGGAGSLPWSLGQAIALLPVTVGLVWVFVMRRKHVENMALAKRQALDVQLTRALENSQTEAACHQVSAAVFAKVAPGEHIELLLTDQSESHLHPSGERAAERPACGVISPDHCPAIRRAQVQVFEDATAIDLCPNLRAVGGGATAVCVPVTMVGRAFGVLHHHNPITRIEPALIETVARRVGHRISLIRAMEASQVQASTDALTGLLNRRSLEHKVAVLQRNDVSFSVALVDLDHFKLLNDTHGHQAGDRALVQWARVTQAALRESDVISRFGGEEFVIVLPNATAETTVRLLGRLRDDLASAIERSATPAFTFSAGVAHSSLHADFETLVQHADAALRVAKDRGRNRIELAESALVMLELDALSQPGAPEPAAV